MGVNYMYSVHLKLKPTPPFNFDLSTKVFSEGDGEIRRFGKGRYRQLLRTGDNLILVTIKSLGTVDKTELLVDLDSNKPISDEDQESVQKTIINIFNLDFDLKPFYEEVKNDLIMAKLAKELEGLNSTTTSTAFEALVSSIIEQQISLKAAHSIERRMVKTFGDKLEIKDKTYYTFPIPQKLASLTKEQLRECGLSYRKAEYIIDLSKQIVEGKLDLEKLKEYEYVNEIIRELSKIRGVGLWTAELTILRGMHKLEAFPADDIGLRRAISHYYCDDKRISSETARKIAARWGKWKGLAGFYLIVAEMINIKA
jgi:DNA-3-methyladenine glycosylase II